MTGWVLLPSGDQCGATIADGTVMAAPRLEGNAASATIAGARQRVERLVTWRDPDPPRVR